MSKGSFKNYGGSVVPSARGLGSILFLGLFALTGCLGEGDGDPHCDPIPYTKTITPIKVQNNRDVYFSPNDFDFLFQPNIVISDISFQGVVNGKHDDKDKNDDFSFDVNGTKCSRKDGDRNVKWNCGSANAGANDTRFCSPMHKFSLNGGLNVLDFLLLVKLQRGSLRLSAHAPKNPTLSNVSIVVTGIEHPKTCPKPPPPPPPPPAVAPKTAITAYEPTGSPSNSTTKSISFAADQTGVSYSCALDGAAFSACTSPKLYSGLTSGPHTFTVKATNSAGLSDANPPSLTWIVDTQPPTVTITNAASLPALTNQTAITLQFASNEASTFSCQLDGAASVCTSPYSYSGLSEGTHKVVITAIDSVGNASANPASFQWAVDLTPPTTTINQVLPAQAINNSAQMTFQFSASETATFDCAIDNGAYGSCQSPYVLDSVGEGSHWFTVRANDAAGNQGQAVSYSWKTDFTPPAVNIVSATPAAGNSNAHNVAVDFNTSEPATVMCSFDGAEPAACASPFTAAIPSEGSHSLTFTATDVAGNVSTGSTISWNMDFTSPILSLGQILPSAAVNKNSSSVSLEVLSNEAVSITAAVNGNDLGAFTSPLVLNGLSEGSYTVVISAFDRVGNPADALTYSFNVDLTAPQLSLSSAITGLTNLDRNTLTFAASESATFACNIDEAGFGACLSPLALSGLADGVHTAIVRATDVAGNASTDLSVQWTVDTTAPVTTVTAAQNGPNSFSFNIAANETGSTFQCSLDGAPAQACTSPVTVQNLSAGPHSFIAQAIDPAGNLDSNGAAANFTVEPPSTALTTTQTANNSVTFTFSSSAAPATFLCARDGGTAQTCTSPLTISGVTAGTHTLLVKSVDAAGNIDPTGASGSWTVLPPTTALQANQTANNAITFTLSSNIGDATYLCSLDGAAAVACTSPYSMSGLSVGTHSILVRAQDSVGNADPTGATYAWTVRPPITTTLSSVTPSAAYTNSNNISFAFVSNHSDATFVCSLNGGAASACTSPASYSGLTDGTKTFTVRAVDAWGNADQTGATYTWTVDTAPPTLVSITTSSTSTSITVNWTTNEPSSTKLFWGVSPSTANQVPDDGIYVTSHSVRITGLTPNTLYTFKPAGSDRAGNAFVGNTSSVRTGR